MPLKQNNNTPLFRLNAKQLFLTYPQCELSKDRVLEILSDVLDIELYIIAQEQHEDGGNHIHAYIKCTTKKDIRSPNTLDVDNYHGKYETCRNYNAVRNYCTKDGNYITNINNFQPVNAAIRVILADSTTEALDIVKNDPLLARDYVRDSVRIEQSLANMHITETFVNLKYRFITMRSIIRWKRNKHSLWLKGPTNTGKTEYAKSLFSRPLLVRHIDDLKKLKPTHDGIVFDDMSFKHWPRESQIHLIDIQNDSTINVKHGAITIPRLMPRIFTSNVAIFTYDPAITRRIRYIKIEEDLRLLDTEIESDSSSANSYEPDFDAYNDTVTLNVID